MLEEADAFPTVFDFCTAVSEGEYTPHSVVQICASGSEGHRARSDGRPREARQRGEGAEGKRLTVQHFLDGHPKYLSGYRSRWSQKHRWLEVWFPCEDELCPEKEQDGHIGHGCWLSMGPGES